ncbi:NAD(P)/FAD-dependent oxidoreductase [Ammoniphilus sp. 3BR4]|uniref:NAD(P)/FAD-dependent oxidoreductase n=1 Tax=Ammoniphilus sp. 3BR4 TaxID=3158265 RepID=UPI003465DE3C
MRKIVILGAGYGGLITAIRLQKKWRDPQTQVTLVNQHSYHYLTTWLHEPAAGTRHHNSCRINIDSVLDTRKIKFVEATVERIRPEEKIVLLTNGRVLNYDYLVIGLGSEPETFGIEGLKEYAFGIRSINSVRMIKEHIEYMFSKFRNEPHRADYLTLVIGGAGFTGIEFVGELADRIPQLCREFDVDPSLVNIYNIEAAPTALPGFDPELVQYAMSVLEKKGVVFKINTAIKQCNSEGVVLATGEEIKTQTVVWTGGVRGNSIIENSGFEVFRGRVKVDEYLRAPGYDHVFVVGDCALIFNEEGRPYPPTAQIATQQGENLAGNLIRILRGGELQKFIPDLKGTVASLGKGEAIGVVGNRKLFGTNAALMKKVIDHRYLYLLGGIPLLLKKSKI